MEIKADTEVPGFTRVNCTDLKYGFNVFELPNNMHVLYHIALFYLRVQDFLKLLHYVKK